MNRRLQCPLCEENNAREYHADELRHYLQCPRCRLVFVPPQFHLARAAEKAEYDLHQNAVDDPGYRRFLSRLAEPLVCRLTAGSRGLDFGCGPAPALAELLQQQGFEVALYDSFFRPDSAALDGDYDFICATEVVEHLHRPGPELARLWRLLRPAGWLGVMTKLVLDREAFSRWHYKRDPTHVSFFSRETWQWWARERGASPEFIGADVVLVQKVAG
jgi:SAM-dependent methyltransferase